MNDTEEQQVVANPDDGFLYHYTSLEAFASIIQNKTMWASDARFSNDTSEQQIVKNLFLQRLQERFDQFTDEAARELFATWQDRFNNASPFFLICFSEDGGDRLSQWRAYGGICVVFRKADLLHWIAEHLSEHTARLMAVRYMFPATLAQLYTEFERDLDGLKNPDHNTELAARIHVEAAFAKHPAFYEEEEWRIQVFRTTQQVRHRTRSGLLVPYIEVSFGEVLTKLIAKVIVGPIPHKAQVCIATKGMLEANGFDSTKVDMSETPYRGF